MNTSDVLNKTADLIEERGWQQGPSGWAGPGRLCLEGGMLAALGQTFGGANLSMFWDCPAYRAVMQYLGRDESRAAVFVGDSPRPIEGLWDWNDDEGRTAEQVIATLRACAVIEAARETADVARGGVGMSKHRHIPRRPGFRVIDGVMHEQVLERQVLIPSTNKAAVHPWSDRLRAAMDGKPSTKADTEAEAAS